MPVPPYGAASFEDWVEGLLDGPVPSEGATTTRFGHELQVGAGVVRDLAVADPAQIQTRDAFGYKWAQTETYSAESPAVVSTQTAWLNSRLGGRHLTSWILPSNALPTLLDAGCGSGFTASIMFPRLGNEIWYVGADISAAVDIAAKNVARRFARSLFVQADMTALPFAPNSFDCIMAEGTLHHTPSTKGALAALVPLLRRGGVIEFYVYAKKGPVREFTDDLIRDAISNLTPEEGWKAIEPLTKLGIALGELNAKITVPEPIPYLGIPAGEIDVQRLFYWYVAKAFYKPDLAFADLNHINYDWYGPKYAHRQTAEDVRNWCDELGLEIEHLHEEQAGITAVARRT